MYVRWATHCAFFEGQLVHLQASPQAQLVVHLHFSEHAQPVESFFESLPHDAQVHESPHLQSALDVHEHDVTLPSESLATQEQADDEA